jgi:AcrR family transcriptional regulator
MKSTAKMSGQQRRADIIDAARRVFVEKGFYGTTTRELARAAGVSEALLFKHFPNKEAIYTAIQDSCFDESATKIIERIEALEPTTANLVSLVRHTIASMFAERVPDEKERSFTRLMLRSLMDEGEFARNAIQGLPTHWVKKVAECLDTAVRAGDADVAPVASHVAGWLIHEMAGTIMFHLLSEKPAIDFGVSRENLIQQAVWFSLRGVGLKEEAIRRHYEPNQES